MKPTRRILFFAVTVFVCVVAGSARAEWRLENSRRLNAADAPVAYYQTTVSDDSQTVELRLVLFDSKKCALRVIDNPGDGSLASAMEKAGCFAGVNGNYFREDRTPVGLVISDGKMLHPFERAKLLTGILAVKREGVALLRTAEWQPGSKVAQALQSGPFLVDRGQPVRGLDDSRRAERTVVISDGKGRCALLVCCGPVTLAGMARILAGPGLIGVVRVVRALNLDGGTSTAFWAKEPAFYRRELKTVRNFLGVEMKPGL